MLSMLRAPPMMAASFAAMGFEEEQIETFFNAATLL